MLRYGELIILAALNHLTNKFNDYIYCFARYSLTETIVVATNLSDQKTQFYIEYGKLQSILQNNNTDNAVVIVKNLLDKSMQYYLLKEFLGLKAPMMLEPFRSLMFSITVCSEWN